MGNYGNRQAKCIICASQHKVKEHHCRVNKCKKGGGKIGAHVTVVCANCRSNNLANLPRRASKYRADVQAWKEKKLK